MEIDCTSVNRSATSELCPEESLAAIHNVPEVVSENYSLPQETCDQPSKFEALQREERRKCQMEMVGDLLRQVEFNYQQLQDTFIQELSDFKKLLEAREAAFISSVTSIRDFKVSTLHKYREMIINDESNKEKLQQDLDVVSLKKPHLLGGTSCGFVPEFTPLKLGSACLINEHFKEIAIGDKVSVSVIGCINSEGLFWVRVLPDQLGIQDIVLQNISNSLQIQLDSSFTPLTSPQPGMYCAARYVLDKRWYRGRIIDTSKHGQVSVFFIDYGNTEEFLVSSLAPLDDKFLVFPPQMLRCCFTQDKITISREARWKFTDVTHSQSHILSAELIERLPASVKNGEVIHHIKLFEVSGSQPFEIGATIVVLSSLCGQTQGTIKYRDVRYKDQPLPSNSRQTISGNTSVTILTPPPPTSMPLQPSASTTTPLQPSTCNATPSSPPTCSTTPLQPFTCNTTTSPPSAYSTTSLQPITCNATPSPPSAFATTPLELTTCNATPSPPSASTATPLQPSTCSTTPSAYSTTLLQPSTCNATPSPPSASATTPLQPSTCNTTPSPPSNCSNISSQTHNSLPSDVTGSNMQTTDCSKNQNSITEQIAAANETPVINHLTQFEDHLLTRLVGVDTVSENRLSPEPQVIQSPPVDTNYHDNAMPIVTGYLASNQYPADNDHVSSETNKTAERSPVSFKVEGNAPVPGEIKQSDSIGSIGKKVVLSTDARRIFTDEYSEPLQGVIRELAVKPHAVIDPLHFNGTESVSNNPIPLQNCSLESDKVKAHDGSQLGATICDNNLKKSALCSIHPSVKPGVQLSLDVSTDLSSEGIFWAHLESTSEYDHMFEQLKQKTSELKENYTPVFFGPDDVCAALFSEDECWYRANIEQYEKEEFAVRYLDFGNLETRFLPHLAPLRPEFALLPPLAFKCSIACEDHSHFTQPEITKFDQLVLESSVSANVLEVKGNIVFVELLLNLGNGISLDLNEEIYSADLSREIETMTFSLHKKKQSHKPSESDTSLSKHPTATTSWADQMDEIASPIGDGLTLAEFAIGHSKVPASPQHNHTHSNSHRPIPIEPARMILKRPSSSETREYRSLSPVSIQLGVTTSKSDSCVTATRERSTSPYTSNTGTRLAPRSSRFENSSAYPHNKDRMSNTSKNNPGSRSVPRLNISHARQHILPHINGGKDGSSKISKGSVVVENESQKLGHGYQLPSDSASPISSKFHPTEHGPVLPPNQPQGHGRPQTQNHDSQDITCLFVKNIPQGKTVSYVNKMFSNYGTVQNVEFDYHRHHVCFVYLSKSAAQKAVDALHGKCLDKTSKPLFIEITFHTSRTRGNV